ncbi:MAG: DNA repair protein RadC [Schleiferiaceae bacterium]|nr:DNA repair protein RadC [Schleiferiaceae bacterium]
MTNGTTIKHWGEADRPREKLLQRGKGALTDTELIAILLGTGTAKATAVDIAKSILHAVDNDLSKLAGLTVGDLMKFKGIGQAKAITLVTAFELGRRKESTEVKYTKVSSSQDAYAALYSNLADLQVEEFWALFLNQANRIMKKERISSGGITATLVDVRVIVRKALESNATGIVVAHNHPSGSSYPSSADNTLTMQIKEACGFLNIRLLDHLIFFHNNYYSYADKGLLP